MAFEFAFQLDNAASPAVKMYNCGEANGVSKGDLLQLTDGEVELAEVGSTTLIGFAAHNADEDEDVGVIVPEDTVFRVPYEGTTKETLAVSDIGTFFDVNATSDKLNLDARTGDLYLFDYDNDRGVAFVMIKDRYDFLASAGAKDRIAVLRMTAADFDDDSETETGFVLPDTAIVKNVYLNVITAETTATDKTIDVGTDGTGSNDPDGFLDGVSLESTGLVKGTLLNTGQTLGALLRVDEGGDGDLVPEPDIESGGEKVTLTAAQGDGLTEAVFDVIIEYIEVA